MFNFLSNKKKKIGFVVEKALPYHQTMASTRLRCYDVIHYLNRNDYLAEVYQHNRKYDVVIFQKCFKDEHLALASAVKQQGTTVVLDININIIEEYGDVSAIFSRNQIESLQWQREAVRKFVTIADYVLVSSLQLVGSYSKYHHAVFCIEEMVTDVFLKKRKKHENGNIVTLLYSGYSAKAIEIEIIKNVLVELHSKYKIELLFVSERHPDINIGDIRTRFIAYDQKHLPALLMEGDIKIAPRDLDNRYNIGHSFTKVAYPMAVGIPAVASPVPSYLNREVIICQDSNSWYNRLEELIKDKDLRSYHGKRSSEFVKNNFSKDRIGKQYVDFLELIAKKSLTHENIY